MYNKTLVQFVGAVALAVGVTSATLGATLAAFATSEPGSEQWPALRADLVQLAGDGPERAA